MDSLVIGAPNAIALELVDRLLAYGDNVRVLVQPGRDDQSALLERLARTRAETRLLPLTDSAGLADAADGVDILYYAEWRYQDWGAQTVAVETATRGLRNVLAAATRNKVGRFCYLSTSEVYGFPGVPVRESELLAPPGLPYADDRAEAEIAVWQHGRRVQLPITIIRPGTIYGPRIVPFVADVVERLAARNVVLVDDGRHIAGLTYVGNLAEGMLQAGRAPEAVNQAYNISDGSNVTWAQYYSALAALAELPAPVTSYSRARAMFMVSYWERTYALRGRTDRPPLTRLAAEMQGVDQIYPTDKARRDFGYRPAIAFPEGLRNTGQWLREAKLVAG
ncbi:MAG: NAD-dependent epimerase/dehydratase family protein [Anaerolineae bacterium]|jgi:nucleoside-diphosphate-sugar epimerase|nr:NAD(P)-dependent oxidoreductase [Chloroflexota bacterium]